MVMSSEPLVSIITPSFNQARFLEQTIVSVLDQDYPSVEYLVVDGNSSDGSQAIIKNYAQKIHWWVSEKDCGQADAINKGLCRARGEIVAWLNSDDYYLPGAISKAVNTLIQRPETAFVYGDVLAVNAAGTELNHLRYRPMSLVDLMEFNILGQSSVFIRKEILEQTGWLDPSFHYLLDHQLWVRLALKAPIVYLPELLSGAHFHPQSKNVSKAGEFGKEAYRIVDWMHGIPELEDLFIQNESKILAGAHRLNARYLLDGNQPWQAFKAYLKCLSLDFPTAMTEWYRILFSLAAILGLGKLKYLHPRWRKREKN